MRLSTLKTKIRLMVNTFKHNKCTNTMLNSSKFIVQTGYISISRKIVKKNLGISKHITNNNIAITQIYQELIFGISKVRFQFEYQNNNEVVHLKFYVMYGGSYHTSRSCERK